MNLFNQFSLLNSVILGWLAASMLIHTLQGVEQPEGQRRTREHGIKKQKQILNGGNGDPLGFAEWALLGAFFFETLDVF